MSSWNPETFHPSLLGVHGLAQAVSWGQNPLFFPKMGLLTEDTWREISLGGVLGLGELHGVVCVMICLELPHLWWSAAHLWSFVLSSLHQLWWQPVQPAAGVSFLCLPFSGHAGGTGFPASNKENTWHCSSSSLSDKGGIAEG